MDGVIRAAEPNRCLYLRADNAGADDCIGASSRTFKRGRLFGTLNEDRQFRGRFLLRHVLLRHADRRANPDATDDPCKLAA